MSERGPTAHRFITTAVFRPRGRLMALMTHNTDVADTWEREGENPSISTVFAARKRHRKHCIIGDTRLHYLKNSQCSIFSFQVAWSPGAPKRAV